MNFKRLEETKKQIESLQNLFETLQKNDWVNLPNNCKFKDLLFYDIVDYIMYIIAADSKVNVREVEIYKYLTGFGGDDIDSIKEYIESNDIMSYDFQSNAPKSLQLLVSATNMYIRNVEDGKETAALTLEHYLLVFIMVGKEMMQSDQSVTYAEKRDYETYLNTMKEYIEEFSYVNLKGSFAELMASITDIL